ncbi:MAG TPA: NADH-quinone oxidoreductase subunit L [Actinomycetota bacterium]|nr:NADH-quinone oxidoreductase subunit L [Actinomycetota bacterium]
MTAPVLEAGFDATIAPWIVALPLASAVVLLLFGRRVGRAAGIVASAAVGLAFLLGVLLFVRLVAAGHDAHETVRMFEWIVAGDFDVGADLLVDRLSMVMVLVVTGVGALIHVYSIGYMHGDERYARYFAYLNLFVAAMLVLVLADNLVLLYVGWEGVGLCSYLLIGFWFERPAAAHAAKKAFVVNRIGDFSFLLGILLLSVTVGSLAIGSVNEAAGAMSSGIATIAALLLFGGATGKSAQIPLYVWLPDAMEGPTPVSALIHAATMVTAGVYMVVRLSPVFEASGDALTVVAWIGAATALWAALMAAAEYDIKRVLAYSTISQLGYMFLAAGVGAYSIAIFHLVTHAFFKALMFLGAGAVMHALDGATDMRAMGGLRKAMPVVGWTFATGWLAISGIVPFAGFFSKDAILAAAWEEGDYALYAVGLATALITAFYMSRLFFRVFEGRLRAPEGAHPHDAPPTMAIALVVLAGLSVVGGVINLPGVLTLEHFLEPVVGAGHEPEAAVAFALGALATVVAVVGIAAARWLYTTDAGRARRDRLTTGFAGPVGAVRRKFYVDELYTRALVRPGKAFAAFCTDVVDRRVIDGVVNGTAGLVAGLSEGVRRIQTGYVRNYAVTFLLGVVVVLSILVLRVGAS